MAKMCLKQRYLTTNLYVFYEVANSYEFIQPNSYNFIRFVYTPVMMALENLVKG